MRRCLFALVVLLYALPVRAQAAPSSYQLQIFAPGVSTTTGSPLVANDIPATAVTCNQPAIPVSTATPVTNPTRVEWDDPSLTGRVCVVDQSQVLIALPLSTGGNFLATLTASTTAQDGTVLTSDRSGASNPFVRLARPSPVTNVKVAK